MATSVSPTSPASCKAAPGGRWGSGKAFAEGSPAPMRGSNAKPAYRPASHPSGVAAPAIGAPSAQSPSLRE